jgi:hypothetical protein
MTGGEERVMSNLRRKEKQAVEMFENLVREMNHSLTFNKINRFKTTEEVPSWL